MPIRMVRDWTDSLKFDGLTSDAERLFIRLIMKSDDYGRFHADPRIVRGTCFPLLDNLRTEHVGRWLDELHHHQLIFRYEVEDQKFLSIVNFGQRLKQSRAKFPHPTEENSDWLPTSGNFRESAGSGPPERNTKGIENERKEKARASSVSEIIDFCKSVNLPESDAHYLWNHWESNSWTNGGHKIKDWQATIRSWKHAGHLPKSKGQQEPAESLI